MDQWPNSDQYFGEPQVYLRSKSCLIVRTLELEYVDDDEGDIVVLVSRAGLPLAKLSKELTH